MARRYPVKSGQFLKDFLVENELLVFPAQLAESRLQSLARGPEMPRNAGHPVCVLPFALLAHFKAGDGGGLKEEVFNHFRDESAFLGFSGLADDSGEIELALRQSLQGGVCDAAEVLGIDLVDDALFDELFSHLIVRVHVAQHLLKLICRENLSEDVEYFAGALGIEVLFDLLDALEELFENPALAGVGGDEVEDEAVLLLTVAVDTAHALLKANRVPRNVVIDHQPAELKVDALSRGLCGDKHLTRLAELAFSVDSAAGRVAVADLHTAVNLGDGQTPLAQLAKRSAIPAVANQKVERVLVLGEKQELHGRIGEDPLIGQQLLEPPDLHLRFLKFQNLGIAN